LQYSIISLNLIFIKHFNKNNGMKKIWQKKTEDDESSELASFVEKFTVGKDYILDLQLLPYDIKASKVHATGLGMIDILTPEEVQKLHASLDKIQKKWEQGEFKITTTHEDGQTAIEEFLIADTGDLGKKIHTGRSRSDQALVATKLFSQENLQTLTQEVKKLAQKFIDFARKYEFIPMPGYTHTQRAMLCSVGMWAGSIAEMLIFNAKSIAHIKDNTNYCPLGSAASFGVNIPLQREFVAKELGFKEPLTISLSASSLRGREESQIVGGFVDIASTLAHFANDLILFNSSEFNFFDAHSDLCTGSSIMPQKKNLDSAELLRARFSKLLGAEVMLRDITKGLMSGYHRDLQLTKEPLLESFSDIFEMVKMAEYLIENITPKEQNIRKSCTPELFAADRANELVLDGMTFRDAYREVGNNLDALESVDLEENIKSKTHLGAVGNLGLEVLEKRLQEV
jgi:argininosuccinate lyase